MKIALVRMRYVPYGGAENYLTLVGKELVRQGHEVHIFSSHWAGNVRSFVFHKVPVIKGLSFLKVLSFAISSSFLLKKDRFDIIISFDRILYQDIHRAADGCHRKWLEQRRKIESPLKAFLRILDPFHKTILYLEKRIYQGDGCKRVVAISFKDKKDIMKYYQTPEKRIAVIYNGVDLNRFNPYNKNIYRDEIRRTYGISDSDIVLLFVGSGFERKGLGFLIRGAGTSPAPATNNNIKILVVGKGNCSHYEEMARRLGIDNTIVFAGTTTVIEKFYAASDIFILPSLYDPFGNACLEAMASGLPVITTKNTGASEIIDDGKDGFILKNLSDSKEMASRIRLLMDRGLREKIGNEARKKAERFAIEESVRKMVELCG